MSITLTPPYFLKSKALSVMEETIGRGESLTAILTGASAIDIHFGNLRDGQRIVDRVTEICDCVRRSIARLQNKSDCAKLTAVIEQLFMVNKFAGIFPDQKTGSIPKHENPRLSLISEVLATKKGTDSVLCLLTNCVCRMLGLKCLVFVYKGRALCRVFHDDESTIVDPFSGGKNWSLDKLEDDDGDVIDDLQCKARFALSKIQLLDKLLEDLSYCYRRAGMLPQFGAVCEFRYLFYPKNQEIAKEIGKLLCITGRNPSAGVRILQEYLNCSPCASDTSNIKKIIGDCRGRKK